MTRWINRAVTRLRSEHGFGLTEALMVGALTVVILAATFPLIQVFSKNQPRITTHGQRIQEARAALEKITRDLRQAYGMNGTSSAALDVLTWGRAIGATTASQQNVIYNCAGGNCTRQTGAAGGSLSSPQRIITGVSNVDIFTYLPDNVNPRYVRIKFTFSVKGDSSDPTGPITLSQGVELRNTYTPS